MDSEKYTPEEAAKFKFEREASDNVKLGRTIGDVKSEDMQADYVGDPSNVHSERRLEFTGKQVEQARKEMEGDLEERKTVKDLQQDVAGVNTQIRNILDTNSQLEKKGNDLMATYAKIYGKGEWPASASEEIKAIDKQRSENYQPMSNLGAKRDALLRRIEDKKKGY